MKRGWLATGVLLALGSLVAGAYTWNCHSMYQDSTNRVKIVTQEANDAVSALERARAAGQWLGVAALEGKANRWVEALVSVTDRRIERGVAWRRALILLTVLLVGSSACLVRARGR